MTPDAGDLRHCRACGLVLFKWAYETEEKMERRLAGYCSRECELSGPRAQVQPCNRCGTSIPVSVDGWCKACSDKHREESKCPRCKSPFYDAAADANLRAGYCTRAACWHVAPAPLNDAPPAAEPAPPAKDAAYPTWWIVTAFWGGALVGAFIMAVIGQLLAQIYSWLR